jgi:hypothetical protein
MNGVPPNGKSDAEMELLIEDKIGKRRSIMSCWYSNEFAGS